MSAASTPAPPVTVRDYRPEDAAILDPQPAQMPFLLGVQAWRITARDAASWGPAWTVEAGGWPVAIAGLLLRPEGLATPWTIIDRAMPRTAWPRLHKLVMATFARLPESIAVHRLVAFADAEHDAGRRWLELLGFTEDSRWRPFGLLGPTFVAYRRSLP